MFKLSRDIKLLNFQIRQAKVLAPRWHNLRPGVIPLHLRGLHLLRQLRPVRPAVLLQRLRRPLPVRLGGHADLAPGHDTRPHAVQGRADGDHVIQVMTHYSFVVCFTCQLYFFVSRSAATIASNIAVFLIMWGFLGSLSREIGPDDAAVFRDLMLIVIALGEDLYFSWIIGFRPQS